MMTSGSLRHHAVGWWWRRCRLPCAAPSRLLHTSRALGGLEEFVESGQYVATGRSWTRVELRNKSDDDLEKLWWVCLKERNRVATLRERERNAFLPGGSEEYGTSRRGKVQTTMKNIKWILRERELALMRAGEEAKYREMVSQIEELVHNDPAAKKRVAEVVETEGVAAGGQDEKKHNWGRGRS